VIRAFWPIHPLGGDHGANEVAHEPVRATIAGIDAELVGDDRREVRGRDKREEGLAEPGCCWLEPTASR